MSNVLDIIRTESCEGSGSVIRGELMHHVKKSYTMLDI